MKDQKQFGILPFTLSGIVFGSLFVAFALLFRYNNVLAISTQNILSNLPNFYLVVFLSFILTIVLYFVTKKRKVSLRTIEGTVKSILQERSLVSTDKSRFEQTMKMAKIGTWELDCDSNIPYVSMELRNVYGLSSTGKVSLQELYKNVHKNDLAGIKNGLELCATSLRQVSVEYRYLINGEICYMTSNISPRINKEGKLAGYFVTVQDITQRHQAEMDLRAANEMVERSLKVKDQFISNMSHEIRTPLNAVIGFTDLISETSLTKEQGNYIEIVKTASQTLLALINNILDLSKIESGNLVLEVLPIDIRHVVKDITRIFEHKAKAKNLQINTNIDSSVPFKVLGDQLRLSQILFNLLGNAIKFTEEGSIDIYCKLVKGQDKQKQYIAFTIKDTGIGVPAEKQNDIFERFTQANTDTQRLYGGSGLGLNIVKSIVDMYGGTLTMESMKDKGTEFHFVLPFKNYVETNDVIEVPSIEGNKGLPPVSPQRPDINILLAEDNLVNAMLAKEVLIRRGYNVHHVTNGEFALDAVQQNKFDVIIMDIQMPVMNGISATKNIRKLPGAVAKIPIIAMTAHSLHGEKQNCFNAGMNGYISKPFKPDDLHAAITECINIAKNKELSLN
jgi:PAS domain S-box-containing protein